jgi:hypothetical protein
LLTHLPRVPFGHDSIRILHRSRLKIFYLSREAALRDGYAFDDDDVCPATGRVFRLAGLRGDGGFICRQIHCFGGMEPERRVRTMRLGEMPAYELEAMLDTADLIVSATGYRLRTVPVFTADGEAVPLADVGPAVDHRSRMLTADGQALENVLGVGLGSDFRPWGPMAGEASFNGQQNSLWLYQNGLGQSIHDSVRRYASRLATSHDTAAEALATQPA